MATLLTGRAEPGRWLLRICHYAMPFIICYCLGRAVLVAAVLAHVPGTWTAISAEVWVGVLAVGFTFFALTVHRARLCDWCIAAWPLDGDRQAQRKRRVLHGFHLVQHVVERWGLRRSVLVVIGGFLVLMAVGTALPLRVAIAGGGVPNCLVAWLYYTTYTHDRLDAWCPWCRRGGGGGIVEPSPDPAGSVTPA